MIVDAIVRIRNIDKNNSRVEIFTSKFQHGQPIILLHNKYKNSSIKLVTGWSDIPNVAPITINGSSIPDSEIGKCNLTRGMFLASVNDNTIYVVTPESLM